MVAAAMTAMAVADISAGFCVGFAVWETADVCVLKSVVPAIKVVQGLVSREMRAVEAA